MPQLLVLHTSSDPSCQEIVARLRECARTSGHTARVYRADRLPSDFRAEAYGSIVLGGCLSESHQAETLARVVSHYRGRLHRVPTGLFTVEPYHEGAGGARIEPDGVLDVFQTITAWQASTTAGFTAPRPPGKGPMALVGRFINMFTGNGHREGQARLDAERVDRFVNRVLLDLVVGLPGSKVKRSTPPERPALHPDLPPDAAGPQVFKRT